MINQSSIASSLSVFLTLQSSSQAKSFLIINTYIHTYIIEEGHRNEKLKPIKDFNSSKKKQLL